MKLSLRVVLSMDLGSGVIIVVSLGLSTGWGDARRACTFVPSEV